MTGKQKSNHSKNSAKGPKNIVNSKCDSDNKDMSDLKKGHDKKIDWYKIIPLGISIASLVLSIVSYAETNRFKEEQRFFEPFSGTIQTDNSYKLKAKLYLEDYESETITIDGFKIISYQGGIAEYNLITMDSNDHILIDDNHDREDPNIIHKKVNEHPLDFGEETFPRVLTLGGYSYFDFFILTTDYTGKKNVYLVSLLTKDSQPMKVIYEHVYDRNILLEENSSMLYVENKSVEVYPENEMNEKIKAKEVTSDEIYAFCLSYSIRKYKTLYESTVLK